MVAGLVLLRGATSDVVVAPTAGSGATCSCVTDSATAVVRVLARVLGVWEPLLSVVTRLRVFAGAPVAGDSLPLMSRLAFFRVLAAGRVVLEDAAAGAATVVASAGELAEVCSGSDIGVAWSPTLSMLVDGTGSADTNGGGQVVRSTTESWLP